LNLDAKMIAFSRIYALEGCLAVVLSVSPVATIGEKDISLSILL